VNIDVTLDGRPWKVAVEPADEPGQFAVTIKGTRRVVGASWVDADTLSLVDAGAAREVRIHRRQDGSIAVEVDGRVYETLVAAKRGREGVSDRGAAKTPSASASMHAIKAPMPGRVVRVLVAVGDRVTALQGVVIVEAMKMENELRTPRDGTVKQVLVAGGTAVETGAVLVIIE
jgi:biotin carboxyl carrier protein